MYMQNKEEHIYAVTPVIHYITYSHHPPQHHNTTVSTVLQHIIDSYHLPAHTGHLTDSNFITHLLYKDCWYWTFISVWLFILYFTRCISIV